MQLAHSNYINRKREEEAERLLNEARNREGLEWGENNVKQLNKKRKPKVILTKKKTDLEKDEKNANEQFLVAQRMLSHASNCLSTAIANNNMIEIKLANELLHSAQQVHEKASVHREKLRKIVLVFI